MAITIASVVARERVTIPLPEAIARLRFFREFICVTTRMREPHRASGEKWIEMQGNASYPPYCHPTSNQPINVVDTAGVETLHHMGEYAWRGHEHCCGLIE